MAAPQFSGAITLAGGVCAIEGTPVLRGVDLAIAPGARWALLGASGSGKSTLLRVIAGLERLSAGELRIDGRLVSDARVHVPAEGRGVGLLFQDFALFPHMRALENIAFGLDRLPPGERAATAMAWMARIGLADRAGAKPHMFSGGEQQRLALARALAPRPRAVLLDEPFSGLDPGLRDDVREATLAAIADTGASAIYVTHDADEAFAVADQVAIMDGGRIVQTGAPRAVYAQPATLAAARAMGPLNLTLGDVRAGLAETPFGPIAAPGLRDGPAWIAGRFAALQADPDGAPAQILARRPQTQGDLVILEAGGWRWRAAWAIGAGPGPGEAVRVRIDPAQTFVFSASSGSDGGG